MKFFNGNFFCIFSLYGVGRRVLLLIVLFSSVVTLAATSLQLYTDYRRDVNTINDRLADIKNSYLESVGASLWNLDVKQLNIQLAGIKQLPDINAVKIKENIKGGGNPIIVSQGFFSDKNVINRKYPVIHKNSRNNTNKIIGTLFVQASLQKVYAKIWDKTIIILLSQGVKAFLVSMFILYIFYRLVTAHLSHIARYLNRYDFDGNHPPLLLQRKPLSRPDELDQVVNAFNELVAKLHSAYESTRQINMALADDIIARRKAEEEVKLLNTELEQRVRQRTAELEAANAELSSFCYSVSHDLRAPLRRIDGFLRMLTEKINSEDEQVAHYLERIEVGAREMTEMIDSFLRLSRATQGELNVESVNLSSQVALLLSDLRQRDPDRHVEVTIEQDLYADVDRRFFVMLITNLLDNAWKYTSREVNATISFGCTEYREGQWAYFVADNGAGFDMTYANRLFSPFTRLHKNTDFEGVGIGLATVQRIVTRHGGEVWAESSPGAGATFYFSLWNRSKEDDKENNSIGRG